MDFLDTEASRFLMNTAASMVSFWSFLNIYIVEKLHLLKLMKDID